MFERQQKVSTAYNFEQANMICKFAMYRKKWCTESSEQQRPVISLPLQQLWDDEFKQSRIGHIRFGDCVYQSLSDSTDADTYVAQLPHLFIDIVSEASCQLKWHIINQ